MVAGLCDATPQVGEDTGEVSLAMEPDPAILAKALIRKPR